MSEIINELKSNLEIMEGLIREQKFTIGDAHDFLTRYYNFYRKMEDLITSRDKWREKAEYWRNKYLDLQTKEKDYEPTLATKRDDKDEKAKVD